MQKTHNKIYLQRLSPEFHVSSISVAFKIFDLEKSNYWKGKYNSITFAKEIKELITVVTAVE